MAVVYCSHANGVVLRRYETVDGPLGTKEIRADAKFLPVELKPGRNEIDDDFWRAWLDQNKGGDLVSGGLVQEEKAANAP